MSINSSEYIAKSDNTRIEYPYNIINNFKDFRERLRLENERKKNDSNLLKQLVPNHITKREQDTFNKRQEEEKSKYIIPYIPEKEITLTSGRYNTGKISTNLLDSIYDAAKRTNTDIWTALAIAGKETGLGIARRQPNKDITNSDLVSNWNQFKTIYLTNNQEDEFYEIQDKIQNGTNTPEELELYKNYTNKLRKGYNSIRPITENPLDNLYKFYKTNNPNPGDPEYKTVKIPKEIELLKADPAIQKWYSTKEPLEYKVGGKFTPKKSQLVKNAESQNTKRDMRKKFIKSDRATYTNNKVRKNQEGGNILPEIIVTPTTYSFKSNNAKMNNALDFTHKQNIGIEPVFNNYLESKDLPLFSKLFQYVRGSNCTLNATRAFGKDSILGTARNITMNPEKYGYKEISSKEAVPGTLVIQSLPEVEDGPNNKYHSMILTGFASDSYKNKFNDSSSENEMIYGYSNGEDSYRERPHNVLATNHGKTKFRYYVPIKQQGGILENQISINPNLFSSWNAVESNIEIPTNNTNIPETKLDRFMELLDSRPSVSPRLFDIERINTEIQDNKPENNKPKIDMTNPSKGTEEFNRIYDEVEREYPEASKYRAFLTTVAKYESGFNSKAKNKNAPAWGYFQFMQDDNKYNNIKTYAGVDTQTFLDNPKLQIIAAINLAKSMEKGFSKEDISAAKSKGITKWGMLGGAWLGGNGGLRRYLLNNENISDKHWSPNNSGIDMINQIKRYNF